MDRQSRNAHARDEFGLIGGFTRPVAAWVIGCLGGASLAWLVIGEPAGVAFLLFGAILGLAIAALPGVSPIKVGAVLFLLTGLSELLFVPGTAVYIARYREHPLVFPGVRGGAGPFDVFGIDAVVALNWLFVSFGAVELLAAALLWRSRKLGGVLACILFPTGLFFWIGFGLPGWLVAGPVRMVLIARGWKALR